MAIKIQIRRGTASQWTSANPILSTGEIGFETDTGKFKIGTANTAWTSLSYAALTPSQVNSDIGNAVYESELATSNTISAHTAATTNVHGITNTGNLAYTTSPTFSGTVTLPEDTSIGNVSSSEIQVLNGITASTSELNILDGVTASASELNVLDGITASTAELNVLDGITANVAQLNVLTGITANTIELNTLDGITASTAELNVLTGIIANVAQLNILSYLTATVEELNTLDGITASTAELNVLDGITANVAQLNILSNVTATSAEINTLDGITASTAELNILDGVTASTAELNVLTGVTANSTELNVLDGITASTAELNILDGVTASASELNVLDGITASTAELNILDGVTANAAEISILSGVSVTSTEINRLAGVTSAIQTQLDGKQPTITGAATSIDSENLTVDRALVSDGSGKVAVSNVTATELSYVDGVTSAIQTQLDAKLPLSGGTMTGKIVLDGDPTQALHAVTKQYVDNISAGLHIHEAAHAATPNTLANLCGSTVTYDNGTGGVGATLTLGAALNTIDGHSLTNGDRILVKNEATQANNGIYVRTSSTVLTRADDFNSAAEIAGGDFVFVENGTLYNSTAWVVENEVNTVGTDAVLWAQFAGAGTVTAGNNISVSGLQVSVADSPSFTGTVTLPATTSIGNVSATEIGYLDGVTSAVQTQINTKAPTNAPTFTGLVTVAANGIAFTDGTQTKQGVPSITEISQKTASYTLSALTERDTIVEISSTSGTTLTIPADSSVNFPVGTTLDIIQTNTGQVTIAGAVGVTVNATPGLKLRTRWSSATLLKRAANSWLVYGDLSA